MNMGDRGLIHSNIPDEGKFRVFDIDSAKEIGTISGGFDSVFVLARKTWKILSIKGDIVNVKRFIGKALPVSFRRSREICFHHLLPIELQREFEINCRPNQPIEINHFVHENGLFRGLVCLVQLVKALVPLFALRMLFIKPTFLLVIHYQRQKAVSLFVGVHFSWNSKTADLM